MHVSLLFVADAAVGGGAAAGEEEEGRIGGDVRNRRDTRKRRVAAVEIGLTFTPINVVRNNATTEKAVTNIEIKGSERGKKGSGLQRGGGGTEGGCCGGRGRGGPEQGEIETGLLILE